MSIPLSTTDKVVPCEDEARAGRVLRLCEGCGHGVYAGPADLRGIGQGGRCVCWTCATALFEQALIDVGAGAA